MPQEVNVTVTEGALQHFCQLLDQEKEAQLGLRLFLDRPGAPKAEVGISFCTPQEAQATDLKKNLTGFVLYVDASSAPFLDEAHIDYTQNDLGGQLAITAPNIHGKKPAQDAPLNTRIQHVLDQEINPQLAQHGGHVVLHELHDGVAYLAFQGGCQGCGMADVTLKQGIEQKLLSTFDELAAVRDVTNHAEGSNPYYEPAAATQQNAADRQGGA